MCASLSSVWAIAIIKYCFVMQGYVFLEFPSNGAFLIIPWGVFCTNEYVVKIGRIMDMTK